MKNSGKNKKTLIVIPAFNEEINIQKLLSQLEPLKNDVLVVDDGSADQTANVVNEMGFACFSRESNLGLSEFFNTARIHAIQHNYTHLISLDADGQHDPQYISRFIKELEHFDLVSGNRFHDLSIVPASKIASNLFAVMLFRKFLNITLPDVACGFRAMKIDAITDFTATSRFGIIYDMLVQHTLAGKQTGFVEIPAIYPVNEPLNTKIPEIIGLLSTIDKYNPSHEVQSMMNAVINKTDFRISISGYQFNAFLTSREEYLFKTNIPRAKKFFSSIQQEIIQ